MLISPFLLASCGTTKLRTPHLETSKPTTSGQSIGRCVRIVVWNVDKRTNSVFMDELGSLLDSSEADIALIQEVSVPADPRVFQHALRGRSWSLSANLRRTAPSQLIGLATASRVPSTGSEAVFSFADPSFMAP